MSQVNLTDVSGQQLRQLLDSSRRRGDAALSYKVLQEMAARREAPSERRGFLTRGSVEARHLEVDLGEPAEDDDLPPMPNWRPPALEAVATPPLVPEPAPPKPRGGRSPSAPAAADMLASVEEAGPDPLPPDANRPLSLWDDDPVPADDEVLQMRPDDLRMAPAPAPNPKPAYRPRLRLVVGFALGITVGAALGFWVGQMPPDKPSPVAPPVAPVQTAALAPTPAQETPSPSAAVPASEAQSDAPASPPDTLEPAHAPAEAPPPAPSPPPAVRADAEPAKTAEPAAEIAPERSAPVVATGCAAAPTPADRTICGDAKLRLLQEALRRAYSDALDAHEDRTLLREHQLAWRDARSAVTDPTRLTQLYEERIRKLKAATAEALAGK
jgi:uncharacterized protein YecT (DUF1311 family)